MMNCVNYSRNYNYDHIPYQANNSQLNNSQIALPTYQTNTYDNGYAFNPHYFPPLTSNMSASRSSVNQEKNFRSSSTNMTEPQKPPPSSLVSTQTVLPPLHHQNIPPQNNQSSHSITSVFAHPYPPNSMCQSVPHFDLQPQGFKTKEGHFVRPKPPLSARNAAVTPDMRNRKYSTPNSEMLL